MPVTRPTRHISVSRLMTSQCVIKTDYELFREGFEPLTLLLQKGEGRVMQVRNQTL
jgi:hypothetical protein